MLPDYYICLCNQQLFVRKLAWNVENNLSVVAIALGTYLFIFAHICLFVQCCLASGTCYIKIFYKAEISL